MRDVAAGDARDRQRRIEHQQGGRAERNGADRRHRDQDSKREAEENGPAGDVARTRVIEPWAGPADDPWSEEDGDSRQQQSHAKDEVENSGGVLRERADAAHDIDGGD